MVIQKRILGLTATYWSKELFPPLSKVLKDIRVQNLSVRNAPRLSDLEYTYVITLPTGGSEKEVKLSGHRGRQI